MQLKTCFNEQQCCAPWASRGECRNNPRYMNLWCRASCGICRPTTYDISVECSNRHVQCGMWANRGECTNNPNWMAENCRQACNRCGITRAQACNVQQ
ncbi:shTK domain protein, partial [Oesophagostomum dentatum]